VPIGRTRALLGQLARISEHDLRLPVVIADLPRHTDALAAEGGLGGPEDFVEGFNQLT
jgi:hypothetical protein